MSTPMSFWLEQDVWDYLRKHGVPYCEIYNMGYERTGCMFCMFGLHMDKESRFERMKKTHPKLYEYCMDKLGLREVIRYCGLEPERTLFNFMVKNN